MPNRGLAARREATEQLHQACVTAIGTGINGALHTAYSAPLGGEMDDLLGKLKRIR